MNKFKAAFIILFVWTVILSFCVWFWAYGHPGLILFEDGSWIIGNYPTWLHGCLHGALCSLP